MYRYNFKGLKVKPVKKKKVFPKENFSFPKKGLGNNIVSVRFLSEPLMGRTRI